MDVTLGWLKWFEPVDRKIVWMRWKNLCWTIGLSRPAAWQHWSAALCIIAMKLNGERLPKHRLRVRAAEMRRRVGGDEGTGERGMVEAPKPVIPNGRR
jgi:hypothetical protein